MTYQDLEPAKASAVIDVTTIDIQARRYLLEPGDAAWDEVVRALGGALGEAETDDLLRAMEIRLRTARHL